MTLERNKTVVQRLLDEIVHKGNPDIVDELIDEDAVCYRPPGNREFRGRDGYRDDIPRTQAVFADPRIEFDDLIAEEDRVVVRWTYRARYIAEGGGTSSNEPEITMTGINIFQIRDGMIVADWEQRDDLGLMSQIQKSPWSDD